MTSPLLKPLKAGALELPNRVIMAPLTRARAEENGVPTPLMTEYYVQRATAGLIISEATAVSKRGYGWIQAPGIFKPEHVKGWQKVTEAVHKAGGRMVLQLWHMGRASHPDFMDGLPIVAPSAIAIKGEVDTPLGRKPYTVPHALSVEEIGETLKDYKHGAALAKEAGFDGVEIHAANGYLIDEFIRDGANKRSDSYGGSIDNRLRFMTEVTETVCSVWPSDRVGIRLSPYNPFKDMSDSDPVATFSRAAEKLNAFNLAYLHTLEALPGATRSVAGPRATPEMRKLFKNTFITNGGYDQALGEKAVAAGEVDAIAYGVLFIANPDLVKRFSTQAPLNTPDNETFYTHEARGYTDYPPLKDAA